MTVGNVTLAPRVVHGLGEGAADERARALLERVGLAAFADDHRREGEAGQLLLLRAKGGDPVARVEPGALDPLVVDVGAIGAAQVAQLAAGRGDLDQEVVA